MSFGSKKPSRDWKQPSPSSRIHKRDRKQITQRSRLSSLRLEAAFLRREGSKELLEACELMTRFEWVVCNELDPEAFSLVNIPLQDSYVKWTTAFGMSKHHLMAFQTILDATVGRVCHPDPEPKNADAIKRTLCGLCPSVPQPTVSDLVDLAFAKIQKKNMRAQNVKMKSRASSSNEPRRHRVGGTPQTIFVGH